MTRAYALALGAGTQAFTVGFGEAVFGTGVVRTDLMMAAGWAINVAVAEGVIRRPAGRRAARARRGGTVGGDVMTSLTPDAAASYELRIGGHLDQPWSTWFDGFTVTHEDDGTTILRGVVRDQSELHGLLAKVRDLGTTLISVTLVEATNGDCEPPADSHLTATSLAHRNRPDEHRSRPRRQPMSTTTTTQAAPTTAAYSLTHAAAPDASRLPAHG